MEKETTTFSCCSNPGCDQPGTSKCSACKTTPYCGPICQTAHWTKHKEECEGHLLKVGNAHLDKAKGFHDAENWVQTLRYCDLALAKLYDMKLHRIEAISQALTFKCDALISLSRHPEALKCAKDRYNVWALVRGPAHPSTIAAAFYLIDCLLHNKEYEDAELYARTIWEIIHTNNHRDNDIPGENRARYVARAADLLAKAIFRWAESGGIPPEEKQQAGEESIARARQSLEIHIQLFGAESSGAIVSTNKLADVLDYFKGDDDGEALGLYQQAITIGTRVYGPSSKNVGIHEFNLGNVYEKRSRRAAAANDMERCGANLELTLPHFREAARIYTAINDMDVANEALRMIVDTENTLRQVGSIIAAAATTAAVRG